MAAGAKNIVVVVAVLAGLLLAGCAKPEFTRQRYETVWVGQPSSAVEKTLGAAAEQEPNVWIYASKQPPHCEARITFQNGLVAKKEWSYGHTFLKDVVKP